MQGWKQPLGMIWVTDMENARSYDIGYTLTLVLFLSFGCHFLEL